MNKIISITLMAMVVFSICGCGGKVTGSKVEDPGRTAKEKKPGEESKSLKFRKTENNHISVLLGDYGQVDLLLDDFLYGEMLNVNVETIMLSPEMSSGGNAVILTYDDSSNSGWPRLILEPASAYDGTVFYRLQANLSCEIKSDDNSVEKRAETLYIDIVPGSKACMVEMITDKEKIHKIANSKDFTVCYEIKTNVDVGMLDVIIDFGLEKNGIDPKKNEKMDLDRIQDKKYLYVKLEMLAENNLNTLISDKCTLTVLANGHVLAIDTLRFAINGEPWNVSFDKTKTSQIELEYPVDETDLILLFENQSGDTDLEIYDLYLEYAPKPLSSLATDLTRLNFSVDKMPELRPGQSVKFKIYLETSLDVGQYDLIVKTNSTMERTLKLVIADKEAGDLSLTRETLASFNNGSCISSISGNQILLMQTQNVAPADFVKYSLVDMDGKILADLGKEEGDKLAKPALDNVDKSALSKEKHKHSNTYFLYGTDSDSDKISIASDYDHAPLKLDLSAFDSYDFVEYPLHLGNESYHEFKGKRYFFPGVSDPGQIYYCAGVICVDVATNRQIWQKSFESRFVYAVSEKYIAMSSIWGFHLRIYDTSTGKTIFRSMIGDSDDNGMYYISSLAFHGQYLYATLEYRRDMMSFKEKKTDPIEGPWVTSRLVRFRL